MFLNILVAPVIDRSTLKNLTLKAGQHVKIDVKISGEPPPTKIWYHNKARLESKENFNVEYEDYKTKISISIADRSHTGAYIIKAENYSGKDEATFDITVLGIINTIFLK